MTHHELRSGLFAAERKVEHGPVLGEREDPGKDPDRPQLHRLKFGL
ncbi:hypothetical protein V5E97_21810 [Singulisphaera sp. Ch08]|uniref:Uncharacterized protein n=1 Tax=Singulisphaera sp. Ch08 TaxID=3120278 RepID=A0AAU7C707_9BACT